MRLNLLTAQSNPRLSLPSILSLGKIKFETSKGSDITWNERKLSRISESTQSSSASEKLQRFKLKDYLYKEQPQEPEYDLSQYGSGTFKHGNQFKAQANFKVQPVITKQEQIKAPSKNKLYRVLRDRHKQCVIQAKEIHYGLTKARVICLTKYNTYKPKQTELEKWGGVKVDLENLVYNDEPLLSSNPKREWKIYDPDDSLTTMRKRELRDKTVKLP